MVYNKAYYEAHRKEFKVYKKRYQDKNKGRFAEYSRLWRERHPDRAAEVARRYEGKHMSRQDPASRAAREQRYHDKMKAEILSHYSNGTMRCARCGFTDERALSIDHLDGNGFAHRRAIGKKGGSDFYRWLRVNQFPPGFQVLCMNCQWIKRSENHEHNNRHKDLAVVREIEKTGVALVETLDAYPPLPPNPDTIK